MPVITVTVPAGKFDQTGRTAIAAQLTDILMEIEGTKGKPLYAAATWLRYAEAPQDTVAVGGQWGAGRYHLSIDTPVGALNLAQKAELISRVTDALLRIEGVEPDDTQRARVYCLINEIPDGGWGFAGQSLTRERLIALRQAAAQGQA